ALLVTLFFTAVAGMAQLKDPVQWNFAAEKKAEKIYEITFTATIVKPWHIYSQLTPAGGPVPTKIVFKTNPLITVNGKAKENGSLKNVHDQYFGVDVKYFDNQVAFEKLVI